MKCIVDYGALSKAISMLPEGEVKNELCNAINKATVVQEAVKTLAALCITGYSLGTIYASNSQFTSFDAAPQSKELIKIIKDNSTISVKDIEAEIINLDWTGCLGTIGSGPRERGFVMDLVEDWWYTV